jgi:hypothetical protein
MPESTSVFVRGGTLWWAATVIALATLVGCGGSDSPTDPGDPDPAGPTPTGPVSAVIGPSGGTVTAITAEGAVVTLAFPAGAVVEPTAVTLRPLPPSGGRWAEVALEPAGITFRKPFTATIVVPDGVALDDQRLTLGTARGHVPLPTSVDVAQRRLSTGALAFFGFAPEASQLPAASVAPTSASPATGWQLPSGGTGNTLGAGPRTCAQIVADGEVAFAVAINGDAFEDAVAAALNLAAALADALCAAEAQQWAEQASQVACFGLRATLETARNHPISSYGQHERETAAILHWATMLQFIGDCDEDWATVLDDEIEDFLTFASGRASELAAPNYNAFLDLRDEARQLRATMSRAYMTGAESFALAVESRALFPVLDAMRAVGFELCRTERWHYPLSRLTPAGFFGGRDILGIPAPRPGPEWPPPGRYASFTTQDIHADLQYCGTQFAVESVVASGGVLTSEHAGHQGGPGQYVREIVLETPTRGELRLSGDLFGMSCWHELPADHEILVQIGGQTVRTLERSASHRYVDGSPIVLEIAEIAEIAGITPKEGSETSLRLVRKRDTCDDDIWGAPQYTLLTAELQWKNPTLEVEVNLPPMVTPGAEVEAEVRVKVIDQLNQAGFFDAIDVVLEVQGGTALEAAGQTDPQGFFRSRIRVDDATPSVAPGLAASSAGLSVTATATSFEEVTASGTASIIPGMCPSPPSWAVPSIDDASSISGDPGTVTINGPNVTYNTISFHASASVPPDESWSGDYGPHIAVTDYLMVVPVAGWPAVGNVTLQIQHSGRAESFRNPNDDAGVGGGLFNGSIGTSGEGLVVAEIDEIREMTFFPTSPWLAIHGGLFGRVRMNFRSGSSPYIKLDYAVTIVGAVDAHGLQVPVNVCTASGTVY